MFILLQRVAHCILTSTKATPIPPQLPQSQLVNQGTQTYNPHLTPPPPPPPTQQRLITEFLCGSAACPMEISSNSDSSDMDSAFIFKGKVDFDETIDYTSKK